MLTQDTMAITSSKNNGKDINARVHGRVITTKVVGVSFEDRQEIVARMQIGDHVWLEREPDNPFDPNAVSVNCSNGEQIGYLSARLAAKLADLLDRYGYPIHGRVYLLTGSSFDSYSLGVVIAFKIPKMHERLQPFCSPWED